MCYRTKRSKFIPSLKDLKRFHLKKTLPIPVVDAVSILSLKKSTITLERTCQSLPR